MIESEYRFDKKRYIRANKRDCVNKKSFPSYRKAAEFNNSLHKRGSVLSAKGKKFERLHVYKCASCRQFHIGHPPRTGRKYLAQ